MAKVVKRHSIDFLNLDFACLQYHQDKDAQWAGDYAEGIHSLGK